MIAMMAACSAAPEAPSVALRLNEIQAVGTHNSFHVAPPAPVLAAMSLVAPELAATTRVTQRPLDEQLGALAMTHVELDVYADPHGGLFAPRPVAALLGLEANGPPALAAAGFKVLHLPDVDADSTCVTLAACLDTVAAWSAANRDHFPLVVYLEPKEAPAPQPVLDALAARGIVATQPVPFDASLLDELDTVVSNRLGRERMVTPDDLRGASPTLPEALAAGWPTVASLRGRVLVVLNSVGPVRERYVRGRAALQGRAMFTASAPGRPDAAFAVVDDPVVDRERVESLVAAGLVVRTLADIGGVLVPRRRDAALGGGAQLVATDLPEGFLEGKTPRCNPVTAPPSCRRNSLMSPTS